MKKKIALGMVVIVVLALLGAGGWLLYNQQIADPKYSPSIAASDDSGPSPKVRVDAGHANFHTIDGRFGPFAKLAIHGGYDVGQVEEPLSSASLTMDILVIANAQEPLTDTEIDAVTAWVEKGGSLLLIADHAPFGGFAAPLAARFGITMGNGFVVTGAPDDVKGSIDFRIDRLGDHPIIAGASPQRKVAHVRSFTGQSLSVPKDAGVLLRLPAGAAEFADRSAVQEYIDGGENGADVAGLAQALAFPFGQGRVAVSGEAAMFTAQIKRGNPQVSMGVGEADNEAFVLNILDWLSRKS